MSKHTPGLAIRYRCLECEKFGPRAPSIGPCTRATHFTFPVLRAVISKTTGEQA